MKQPIKKSFKWMSFPPLLWLAGWNCCRYLIGPLEKIDFQDTAWSRVSSFGGIFIVVCRKFYFGFSFWLYSIVTFKLCIFSLLSRKSQALNMGAECGFQTKQQLNDCILRCPWSEYPLTPVHRACRDGDMLSLTYLTVQGDRLAVFRSINDQDQFLMWTPAHWAAYFGKVSLVSWGKHLQCTASNLTIDHLTDRSKSQCFSFSLCFAELNRSFS